MPSSSGRLAVLAGLRGNTRLLPIAAAVVVVVLLLWYALARDPAGDSDQGAALGAAAGRDTAAGAGTGASGASSGGEQQQAPAAVVAVPTTGENGCATAARLPGGVTTQTLTVGDTKRTYLLSAPQPSATSGPLPLVINFHAAGQQPTDFEADTGLASVATKQGYAVAVPAALNGTWNVTRSSTAGPDDVAFVAAMLADLHTRACLADDRIYAAGLGDGADMAVTASCAIPGRIAAIVSVAGSVVPGTCEKPVTNVFEIHGSEDAIAPWDGGGSPRSAPFAAVTTQPVTERLGRYAKDVGCTDAPTAQKLPGLGELVSWGCQGKPDVGALNVSGGGHTWPQAAQAHAELGPTSKIFSATVVSLLYFKSRKLGTVVSAENPSFGQGLGAAIGGDTAG